MTGPKKKALPDPVLSRGEEMRELRRARKIPADQVSEYYAPCTLGLEEVLAEELRALGASEVEAGRGGARFRGNRKLGYAACLWLRSAIRVQQKVAMGEVRKPSDLYDLAHLKINPGSIA